MLVDYWGSKCFLKHRPIGPRKKLCMLCFRLTCSFKLSLLITNLVKAFMPCVLVGSTHVFSFPNDPNQSATSHTSSVGGFSRSHPRSFPFFFSSLQDKVVSATLLPAFLLGVLATQDPWTNNPSTNQRNHGSDPWTGTAVWFLGLGSYGPGLVFPCSDAVACDG